MTIGRAVRGGVEHGHRAQRGAAEGLQPIARDRRVGGRRAVAADRQQHRGQPARQQRRPARRTSPASRSARTGSARAAPPSPSPSRPARASWTVARRRCGVAPSALDQPVTSGARTLREARSPSTSTAPTGPRQLVGEPRRPRRAAAAAARGDERDRAPRLARRAEDPRELEQRGGARQLGLGARAGGVAVGDDDDALVDRPGALGDHRAQRLAPVDRLALVRRRSARESPAPGPSGARSSPPGGVSRSEPGRRSGKRSESPRTPPPSP